MGFREAGLVAGLVFLGAVGGQVQAADPNDPPADTGEWTFTGAAYIWGSGLEGKSGVFGFPAQDVEMSFSDVLENLNMAFIAAGEARNGPFSIGVDIVYGRLKENVETPVGILATDIDVTSSSFMGTGVLGYALVDTGNSHIDAIAGARVWSVSTDFDFNGGILGGTSANDGATWVDPLVGAKLKADLGSDVYLSGWGMIGGFGVSSDLMWDIMGGIGYDVSERFSLFGGYRAVSVDYSHNGFVYDVVQQGPIFAGVLRF